MAPNTRSSTDLNFLVVSRYVPRLERIVAIASYAVLYTFSPTTGQDSEPTGTWRKAGVEGSLFICSLSPPSPPQPFRGPPIEEYQLIILNRRGVDNFTYPLKDPNDIDFSEAENIINIRSTRIHPGSSSPNGHANGTALNKQEEEEVIYGLWIHSEEGTSSEGDSSRIAKIVLECTSTYAANQAATLAPPSPPPEPQQQRQPPQLGRSISVADLFQQQRGDDSGFGLRSHFQREPLPQPQHHPPPQQFPFPHNPQYHPQPNGYYPQDPAVMGGMQLGEPSGDASGGSDVLNKLFERANDARQKG